MHILVATDGTLDAQKATDAIERWYREGDEVTVFTAMNIPADFVEHLGDKGIKQAANIALEAGQGFTAGDRIAERLAPPKDTHAAPPVDSPMLKSLVRTAEARTQPVLEALKARGIDAKSKWTTTNNRTAKTTIAAINLYGSELVVIGSHGGGRFEGLLGSTGTKLVRHSPAPVLVIRNSR